MSIATAKSQIGNNIRTRRSRFSITPPPPPFPRPPAAYFAPVAAAGPPRIRSHPPSSRPREAGVGKVVALVEQRIATLGGEGVGEAIAEVEPRRVAAAPAEVAIGLAGDAGLCRGHRSDVDAQPIEQKVQPVAECRIPVAVDDDRRFKIVAGRHRCLRLLGDQRDQPRSLGFIPNDCDNGRAVDNHFGSPSSSYRYSSMSGASVSGVIRARMSRAMAMARSTFSTFDNCRLRARKAFSTACVRLVPSSPASSEASA